MKTLVTISLLVLACGIAVALIVNAIQHPCIRSHEEPRHQYAYTSIIPAGKVMVPVFHPAYDYMATVCDEHL